MPIELKKIKKLIICCCSDYQLIKKERIQELYAAATNAGVETEFFADFCSEAIENPDKLEKFSNSSTMIAACYPRAVTAFFARSDISAPVIIDIRNHPVENFLKQFGWDRVECYEQVDLPIYRNDWKAWFPVIDANRCTKCGKCIDFCFFGTFKKKCEQVKVEFPKNCKTNCPACARMCPEHAIIFPKHIDAPINGGESNYEVTDRCNKDNKFDENLYQLLALRRRTQKNKQLLKE